MIRVLISTVFIWLAALFPAWAEEDTGQTAGKTFTIYFENDSFNQTDRHYTNGFKLTWIMQDLHDYKTGDHLPQWSFPLVAKLPFINVAGAQRDISFSLGQNIYTPEDILTAELIEDDRPYAGITYFGLGLHSKTPLHMDTLEFYVGIVGPHSYAEKVQKRVHDIFDSDNPEGWDNQLRDEPVLGVTYEHKRKLFLGELGKEFGYDLSVHAGGGLGNAYTFVNSGTSFRFGFNLPGDFGTCRILPVSCSNPVIDGRTEGVFKRNRLGIYFFLYADGQGVLHNIFLDGNTFKESHHVDKKPFVADFMAGGALIVQRFRISAGAVYRTKSFETQKEAQEYVTLNISVSY